MLLWEDDIAMVLHAVLFIDIQDIFIARDWRVD